jgi:hypothetical protein
MAQNTREEMFTLLVDTTDAQSATIPVRWCLKKNGVTRLKEAGIAYPYVLLICRNTASGHEQRWLKKLDEMLTYVAFHGPGENTLHAILVGSSEENGKDAEKKYLAIEGGKYTYRFFNPEGEPIRKKFLRELASSSETITVDAQFFAPALPSWLNWWVNLWFETKPKDQCQVRRRAILAFTLQAALIAIFLSARMACAIIIMLWTLLMGRWPAHFWQTIFHPWRGNTVTGVYKDSADWPIFGWNMLLNIFRPAIPIFGYIIARFSIWSWHYEEARDVYAFFGYATGVVIACVIIMVVCSLYFEKLKIHLKEVHRLRKLKMAILRRRQLGEDIEPLLCMNLPMGSVTDIPASKKTIGLRFAGFKALVCKPFAQ